MNPPLDPPVQRLDTWLWAVRMFKTRSVAGQAIRRGAVRITRNGSTMRTVKPAFSIGVGDIVTLARGREVLALEVLATPPKRLAAKLAVTCYRNRMQASHDPIHQETDHHA
ncbi:MAG: S4 domain-containing protein [Pseudomonadota bacterium]